MLDGAGLTAHSAAANDDQNIELVQGVGSLQRLLHDHSVGFIEEILLDSLVVDRNISCSRSKEHASRRCLSAACSVMLN